MALLDWSQCPAVESIPGKVSGAWVLRNTRMPVATIFENLEAGANIDDVLAWYDGLDRDQVKAVIEFSARRPPARKRDWCTHCGRSVQGGELHGATEEGVRRVGPALGHLGALAGVVAPGTVQTDDGGADGEPQGCPRATPTTTSHRRGRGSATTWATRPGSAAASRPRCGPFACRSCICRRRLTCTSRSRTPSTSASSSRKSSSCRSRPSGGIWRFRQKPGRQRVPERLNSALPAVIAVSVR